MAEERITLNPVGTVAMDAEGFALHVDEAYREALVGLDGFSHVVVLWWCHLFADPKYRHILTAETPYRGAPDQLGIFATRSPVRPNPIAVTPVQVLDLDVDAGIIRIPFIDAEPGTPILDLKPYHPSVDRVRDCALPDWCARWPQWLEDSATFDWNAVFVNAR